MSWADVDKPKGSLLYLSLEDGETKRVRILDEEPHTSYVHKISQPVNGEDVFLTVPATPALDDDYISANTKRYPVTAMHNLRVAVYDDNGDVEGIKVLSGGVQIFKPLKQFWQRYGDVRKFDVEITRNGSKRDTEYQVTMAPDSHEIDLEDFIEIVEADEALQWDKLFPEVTAEEQQKMLARAKIDITYDPAEEIAAEMSTAEALATYCTLNKYGPKTYPPKGKTLGEILVIDAGYIEWIAENVTSDDNLAAAARVAIRHMELQESTPKKALPKGKGATAKSTPVRTAPSKLPAKEEAAEAASGPVDGEWTLKMTPKEYLEKFPRGPKAALAEQMLGKTAKGPAKAATVKPGKTASSDRDALVRRINVAFESNPAFSEASDIVEAIKTYGGGKTRIKDLTDGQLEALCQHLEES